MKLVSTKRRILGLKYLQTPHERVSLTAGTGSVHCETANRYTIETLKRHHGFTEAQEEEPSSLSSKTVKELKALAEEAGVEFRSKATKADLLALLQ